jgi:uncharacterized protein YdeI (YjbR/CyaY-like superfamily)
VVVKQRTGGATRQEELMTEAGVAVVEAAKRDGSWDVYDAVEQLTIPSDLEAVLADDKAAGQNFAVFSPSNKKQLLRYVASAKRLETRRKRIAQIVHAAAQNNTPLAYAASKK